MVFDNDGNNFTGPVDIKTGMLSIGNGAATGSLGNPTSVTNNGLLRVNKLNGGTITINGPISGTGALEVTGGAPFTAGVVVNLNGTNSYDGATTVGSGCQINFASSTGLGSTVGATTVLAGGRVGVQTIVPGGVSTSEPFILNGDGNDYALNIEGALIVNGNNNLFNVNGPVTLASSSRIRAWNVGTRMNLSNTVLVSVNREF